MVLFEGNNNLLIIIVYLTLNGFNTYRILQMMTEISLGITLTHFIWGKSSLYAWYPV